MSRIGSILLGLLISVALVSPSSAQAQPIVEIQSADSIALPDVLQIAIRQNQTLELARIDIDVAQAQVTQSLGIDDLVVRGTIDYFRQADASVDGNVIGTDASTIAEAEISISKLLSTGGTISLGATNSRRASTLSFNDTEVTSYNAQLSVRFDQPLLRGRGKALSRATQTQAKHNLSANQLSVRGQAQDEVRRIVDAYWELVWAHKDLEIRVSALRLAQTRRDLTEAAIKLGSTPRTALVAVDQVMATNEEDILVAKQRVTERSLELRRLAGLEIGPRHLDLQPAEDLSVSSKAFSLDVVVAEALKESPQLAALAERKKGARISVTVAENGMLPSLNLNLSAGPLGTDNNLGGSLTGLAKFDGYFIGGGLSYEQRLRSRRAAGSKAEAVAQVAQVQLRERDLRAQIATAAAQAVLAADIAQKRMELSTRAIGLSEQNIEAEQQRFGSGRSTNFDVLERQEELKQARLRYARAAVDYLRASTAIQTLRGEILKAYGISLDQTP